MHILNDFRYRLFCAIIIQFISGRAPGARADTYTFWEVSHAAPAAEYAERTAVTGRASLHRSVPGAGAVKNMSERNARQRFKLYH